MKVEANVRIEAVSSEDTSIGKMKPFTKTIFEATAAKWLQEMCNASSKPVKNLVIRVQEQKLAPEKRRKLIEAGRSLFMEVSVEGYIEPGREQSYGSDFENDINRFFDNRKDSDLLVGDLHETGGTEGEYFSDIWLIKSVRGEIDDQVPNYGNSSDGGNIIMVAATASVVAFVAFALVFYVFVYRKRQGENSKEFDSGQGANSSPNNINDFMPQSDFWDDRRSQRERVVARLPDDNLDYNDGYKFEDRSFSTLDKMYQNDNVSYQSYGYSLDDGIRSKATITPTSAERPAPEEVDVYNMPHQSRYNFAEEDDNTIEVSIGSPASTYSGLTDLGTAASFTQAKQREEDTDEVQSKFERSCVAPPGKLGIVVDTTKNGPVVHMVREESPLRTSIFPGDKIIAIDDIDTRGMTASGVTKIMGRRIEEDRKITISSSYDDCIL